MGTIENLILWVQRDPEGAAMEIYKARQTSERDLDQAYGELYIDEDGDAHFVCHTHTENFAETEIAIRKFMALFQKQLDGRDKCPFAPREGKK